jgi:CRISPR-associated protein Cmr6
MGHSNVLENVGFSFERISGLPYVPGSALKGVVSNWAIWEANGNAAFEEHLPNFLSDRAVLQSNLADIFGNNEGDAEQGKINFYGIFPIQVPELKVDILTPHQGRILPNHFLTVDTGIVWAIPIALNRGDERLLDKAQELVENCLCNYGIGAKTAAGYGKFDQVALERLAELKKHLEEKNKQQKNAVLAEKKRKEQARLKAKADREARIAEQQRRAQMAPEDLAYEDYVRSVTDWTGPAREIASKSEDEQKLILRFFRSKKGQEILADWTNPKGKKRIQNLKEAGL